MKPSVLRKVLRKGTKNSEPGHAFGYLQDGKLVLEDVQGLASLELPSSLTRRSVFNLGSVAKQFTAACFHRLELQGKLSLDDRLRKHLPELPALFEPVRLRHLLWHCSGIPCYTTMLWFSGLWHQHVMPRSEAMRVLGRLQSLLFKPGTRFLYGNSNYMLLAEIIVRVGAAELGVQAKRTIFKPLGMDQTHFREWMPQVIPGLVQGHRRGTKGWLVDRLPGATAGAGRLMSSLADMELWALAWTAPSKGLKPLLQRMRTRGRLDDGSPIRYGSGLMWHGYRGLGIIRHDGYTSGCRTEICHVPDLGASFVCLYNRTDLSPTWTIRQALAAAWPRRLAPVKVWPDGVVDRPMGRPESRAAALKRLGTYKQDGADRVFKLSATGRQLLFEEFKTEFPLRSDRPGGFQGLESGSICRLDFYAKGRVRLLRKGQATWYRRLALRRGDARKDRRLLGTWHFAPTLGELRFSLKGRQLQFSDDYWTGRVEAMQDGSYYLDFLRLELKGAGMRMANADAFASELIWTKVRGSDRVG